VDQTRAYKEKRALKPVGGTAALVAMRGRAVPFLLGWDILLLRGEPQIEAIFTGAAMVAVSRGLEGPKPEAEAVFRLG
jgi:Kef-type K+ transport system membrane component KefB